MNALPNDFGHYQPVEVQLEVSRYDRVASMLVSLLILIGVSVMLLGIVWLTNRLDFRPHPDPKIMPVGRLHDPNDAAGFELAMATPGLNELPELTEPLLAKELEAVTDAASTVSISGREGPYDSILIVPGPDGPDINIVPRWERWQIRWTSTGLKSYARQLDFFKIELGAAGGKAELDYAFNLSKDRPDTKEGASQAEKRLYMTWRGGTLAKFDKTILARAGIPTTRRVVLQFYPELVEDRLALIEVQNAESEGHTDVREFRKTYFGVRAKGEGYEFFVDDQEFREAPR